MRPFAELLKQFHKVRWARYHTDEEMFEARFECLQDTMESVLEMLIKQETETK